MTRIDIRISISIRYQYDIGRNIAISIRYHANSRSYCMRAAQSSKNKKAVLSQRKPSDAPYIGIDALKNFGSPWLRPWLLFPKL